MNEKIKRMHQHKQSEKRKHRQSEKKEELRKQKTAENCRKEKGETFWMGAKLARVFLLSFPPQQQESDEKDAN
jgi:hypothetical protein